MDFYSDDSDPDIDEDLQKDLDALRQSCVLSGNDPDAAVAQVSPYLGAPTAAAGGAPNGLSDDDDDDDEEDEDLALVRSIRENLLLNKASPSSPLPDLASSSRPICAWPPSDTEDDDEDDLETLRAIQRRFSHYHSSTSTESSMTMKNEASKGADGELIAHIPGVECDMENQNQKDVNRNGFPKAALLLVEALKKNRACQKFIRRKMINIEAKIEVNKDLRERVKCLISYQSSCRKSFGKILCQKEDPRVRLISSRKQQCAKDKYRKMPALYLGPAENPHVPKYKMVLKQFPMSLQKQSWSDVEKDNFAKGLKQQYEEILIVDSMNNGSSIGDFSAVNMAQALRNTAGNFEMTPESLRSVLPLIDWDKIAAMYLPGRSGAECESRWLNYDDPLINHKAWTAQEEKRLLLIIQERGMHNWINIAVTLGTHRTPFQCLARYQRSLNPHILKRVWTKEDDLQLLAAVETFGCNWQLVSATLDGHCSNQCSRRWKTTLMQERTRVGRWSEDEDKRLMVSVKLFGSRSWNKIAQFIPGRTQCQCNERWHNVLDPDIDLGEWRPEEDSKLLASVIEVGPLWSKIAGTMIPHRTDNMCMRRWKRLRRDELPLLEAANQTENTTFQSNFADRETERPAIAPSDFPLLVHSKVDRGDESTASGQVMKPRKWSRRSCKDNSSTNAATKSSLNPVAATDATKSSTDPVVKSTAKRPRKKSCRSISEKQTGENISVPDNEATLDILSGSMSADNVVTTNRKGGSAAVGKEGSAEKRTRRPVSVGNEGAVKRRMRGSISIGDDAAVRNSMRGSATVGKEGPVKKRARDPVSVGNQRTVKRRTRGSVSVGDDGTIKNSMGGSDSIDTHGGATETSRSRKSAKDNSTAADMLNAASELDLPSVLPEGRGIENGNLNTMRRKSTPRPKQINMAEGASEEYSTCTRLANCLFYARRTNRNRRLLSSAVQSNGPAGENLHGVAIPAGQDPVSVENGSSAKTSDGN